MIGNNSQKQVLRYFSSFVDTLPDETFYYIQMPIF